MCEGVEGEEGGGGGGCGGGWGGGEELQVVGEGYGWEGVAGEVSWMWKEGEGLGWEERER